MVMRVGKLRATGADSAHFNSGISLVRSKEILRLRWSKQTPKRAERLSNRLATLGVPAFVWTNRGHFLMTNYMAKYSHDTRYDKSMTK